jgi:hypothetical protein
MVWRVILVEAEAQGNETEILVEGLVEEIHAGGIVVEAVLVVCEEMMAVA